MRSAVTRTGPIAFISLIALLLGCAPAARAQSDWWGAIVATAARERIRFANASEELRGMIRGLEGGVEFGRFLLRMRYAEGSLRPRGSDMKHDLTESFLLVGMRVVGGLELAGGLQARAYTTSPGTERWMLWQLRARYEAPVVLQVVHAYAELWQTASGSVNAVNILRTQPEGTEFLLNFGGKRVSKSFQGARGGEAGILIRGSGRAPTVRLGYSIDQARLDAGGYRDSVEGLTIAIGFDTRRNFD